jgi:hypothetical protein
MTSISSMFIRKIYVALHFYLGRSFLRVKHFSRAKYQILSGTVKHKTMI